MDNGLATTDGAGIHIDRNMWGPALQAGLDVNLQDKWLLNVDVKKIWLNTDVFSNPSTKIDDLDIDPWVVSFGIGKKF
jgi:outer membrane protein